MAADSPTADISAELPRLVTHLATQLSSQQTPSPDLLDGAAGAALALHAIGTGTASAPSWDSFLALA